MTTITLNLNSEYTSVQVCELAGVTYRQLSYWSFTGLLVPSITPPSGSGSRAIYSYEDVQVAGLIGYLGKFLGGTNNRDFNATLRQIVDGARVLIRANKGTLPEDVYVVFMSGYETMLTVKPVADFPYFHAKTNDIMRAIAKAA